MANPALMQKKNGRYLWFALLGMGFQPDTAILSLVGKTNPKYINLGPNMFDKPNKDAFYIVTHFLLEKLNPTRFHEAFRHCWPVVTPKVDAEFRKVACAWLREIMDETANAGSKVVASLFLSPGGHKFISLMLHLASHVMLQEMKTFATDDDWVPEGAAMPASSLDMAARRLDRINARFLKAAVEQDHFLREYQRRAH